LVGEALFAALSAQLFGGAIACTADRHRAQSFSMALISASAGGSLANGDKPLTSG
jgi:predicted outer membrane repeat protein